MDAAKKISRRGLGRLSLGALGCATLGCTPRRGENRGLQETQPSRAAGPNATFWREQAQRMVDSARMRAGETKGAFKNTTAYDVHVPGGNMGYPAFWTRDAVMMLGGDFIPADEIKGWIRLLWSTLRDQDWPVRPGVVIPAYAVPDHVNFDGKGSFYPGSYDSSDKQGGPPFGKYPPLDDNFYLLTAVYEYWKLTGGAELLRPRARTFSGEADPLELCEKVYRQPLSDPATGLVMAADTQAESAKDWGFCDAESKSGKLLFPSVLKMNAARQMAEVCAAFKQKDQAAAYRRDAQRIAKAITTTFLHPSADGSEAWLHSSTGVGNQPDVWGSAFAAHSGALDTANAKCVGRALARAYRERTAVRSGLIRQILTTDTTNKGGWEVSISEVGTYQNGGYWGTPVGWYIAAVHLADPAAAADLAKEYILFLREHQRPDGTAEAWEWFNPDTGGKSNPLYVATVALPYLSLKQAGLLSILDT
jgi:hypothetical protein